MKRWNLSGGRVEIEILSKKKMRSDNTNRFFQLSAPSKILNLEKFVNPGYFLCFWFVCSHPELENMIYQRIFDKKTRCLPNAKFWCQKMTKHVIQCQGKCLPRKNCGKIVSYARGHPRPIEGGKGCCHIMIGH